jgi:hypothetical protein
VAAAIGDANPLTYAVDATRSLFNGQLATSDVLWGLLIMAASAVVASPSPPPVPEGGGMTTYWRDFRGIVRGGVHGWRL